MPILDVEIVARRGESWPCDRTKELARRAGEIFHAPAGAVWVKVRVIESEFYAESDADSELALYPVFVSILKAKWPRHEAMLEEVSLLTSALAEICNRPRENVHLFYLPEASGRVAFGGTLLEDTGP